MDQTLNNAQSEDEWISVADLMAALMIVFMFIAIVFIKPLSDTKTKVREIAVAWQETERNISAALIDEFQEDLKHWDAEIDPKNLIVRFKSPEILFDAGKGTVKPRFKYILNDFFPRYIRVLETHHPNIDEIRIEGHTSSDWGALPKNEAYFKNMALSQTRTRSVLEHVLRNTRISTEYKWVRDLITANGLSSSKPRLSGGIENKEQSRRVEFRVKTKAKSEIVKILETVK